MRTKEQMMERYEELYNKMKSSKDVRNMKAFGDAMTWFFMELSKTHPEMADKFLSHIECIEWENYLSADEAMNISKRTVNQDGTKGFHWPHDIFMNAVKTLGGVVEDKPYYNSYALCVTANNIYSDHAQSIAEDMGYKSPKEVPNERMALSCYKKAVEKLKDPDKGFFVRKYFKKRMYADSPTGTATV